MSRKRVFRVAAAFLALSFGYGWAQSGESLGEVARRQREQKKSGNSNPGGENGRPRQSTEWNSMSVPIASPDTNIRLSDQEKAGLGIVLRIMKVQDDCKDLIGHYLNRAQLTQGCTKGGLSTGQEVTVSGIDLARTALNDENGHDIRDYYDFQVVAEGDKVEVEAKPQKHPLGGFLCDGSNVYYNPRGPASKKNASLGNIHDRFAERWLQD